MIKILNILLIILLNINFLITYSLANENLILVYPDIENGKSNPLILGSNVLGHKTQYYPYDQFSNYGSGLWDPKSNIFVKKAINLAKESGISALRFPGGCGTHLYNWKDSIGKKRKQYYFGLDEFIKLCQTLNAEPVITVSYYTGDEKDAADLVEYLNVKAENINSDKNAIWAFQRAQNGHIDPYNVKYFEIGNEVWHGNHHDIKELSPERYSTDYLKYFSAMKAIDPSIKIGVTLWNTKWNEVVLNKIKDKLDFGVLHIYPGAFMSKQNVERTPVNDLFKAILSNPEFVRIKQINETLNLIKKTSGKNIPLAVTEFNAGFRQEKPVPYRHCLGTALINAEMIRIMMLQGNNIIMANNWNLINEYWGMISNKFTGNPEDLYNIYIKRPNYLVFEMYKKHFGEILINSQVNCPYYLFKGKKFPCLSVISSKTLDSKKVYLMIANKSVDEKIITLIKLQNFNPSKKIRTWILNGPEIDSTNELNPNNVKISKKNMKINGNSFEFAFEPHSLTAIEIER